MARLIFISPYLKGGKNAKWLRNRAHYFATREGVVLPVTAKNADAPPTKKQMEYIQRLTKNLPLCRELMEYEDYREKPTHANAAEFISQAYKQFVVPMDQRENYIDYVANRPGTQQQSGYGLWDANGPVRSLHQVEEEVSHHAGNVWTPIVSLRREDAERLGYTDIDNWRALVCSCVGDIAAAYKIHPNHLKWYAALHTKEKHVHIHMILYSQDPKEGYLTKQGIRQVKSAFASRIFRQDRMHIYETQAQQRNVLRDRAAQRMAELINAMECGTPQNERVVQLTLELAERLSHTKGRKVYGYLPPRVKAIVDEIVDELAKDVRVAEAYEIWQELQEQKCLDYSEQLPERVPLSRQKEFKMVRNMVISEALKLSVQLPEPLLTPHTETAKAPMQEGPASAFVASGNSPAASDSERPDTQPEARDPLPDEGIPLRQDRSAQESASVVHSPAKPDDRPLTAAASVVWMLHHMGNIFRDVTVRDSTYGSLLIDRQRRKELQDLRGALGHPEDDHEDESLYYVNDLRIMR